VWWKVVAVAVVQARRPAAASRLAYCRGRRVHDLQLDPAVWLAQSEGKPLQLLMKISAECGTAPEAFV
jgi:hypothetical protein